ncbi:MAG: DUF2157 domain-containing protein, partial [Flavobacterium sp.]|nr:DUF2157 domain-containing protein [Flavobacterium sp.]
MSSKIVKELPKLVDAQIISPETAKAIEHYYRNSPDTKSNSLLTIFGVLGAILIGLGIILIFAHNWDDFPKAAKVTLAFLPLVICQFFTGYAIVKQKSTVWKEVTGTFLFFSIGATIALISQIYNIPGNLSNFLLTWILLSVPVLYILKSNALALLHLLFTTYYGVETGYGNPGYPWLYLLLIALFLPHYYSLCKHHPKGNITSVFHWLLPFSITILLGAFFSGTSRLGFLIYISLFGLFYNTSTLSFFEEQRFIKNGYPILGVLGTSILSIILSSKWFWLEFYQANHSNTSDLILLLSIQITTLVLLGRYFLKKKKDIRQINGFQVVFLVFNLIFLLALTDNLIGMILTNIVVLFMGALLIKNGSQQSDFTILNYGLVIIAVLIICRFFVIFFSFVIRGLLFIAVGVGFFYANYILLQKTKN